MCQKLLVSKGLFRSNLMPVETKLLKPKIGLCNRYPIKKDYPILLILILLATFLRFNGLNKPGLWQDEAVYTIAAQKPISDQIVNPIKTLREDSLGAADPVLSAIPFSLALKLGFSNYLARFPAALFGILSVAILYRLGRALLGNLVGLLATFLLCTSSFHLLYSQEARSYSQLTFFTIGSFLFLYRAITGHKWIDWLFYTLFIAAGISSHYDMAFAIVIQGIFLALFTLQKLLQQRPKGGAIKTLLKSCGPFLLSVTIVFLLRLPWLKDFFYWSARTLGGPYQLDLTGSFISSIQALTSQTFLVLLIYLFLCVVGVGLAISCSFKSGALLACWLTLSIPVTIIGLWFVSQFFHQRHTIWGLPGILVATAGGIITLGHFTSRILTKSKCSSFSKLPSQPIQFGVIILLAAPILLVNLSQMQQIPGLKQSWPLGCLQEATSYITAQAQPNETVIGIPNAQYLQLYIQPVRQDLFYLDIKQHILPPRFEGRWYVFYGAEDIPPRWDQLGIEKFQDILVLYRPNPCKIADCLSEANTLLSEIAHANPDSPLAEKIEIIMAGLPQLLH